MVAHLVLNTRTSGTNRHSPGLWTMSSPHTQAAPPSVATTDKLNSMMLAWGRGGGGGAMIQMWQCILLHPVMSQACGMHQHCC